MYPVFGMGRRCLFSILALISTIFRQALASESSALHLRLPFPLLLSILRLVAPHNPRPIGYVLDSASSLAWSSFLLCGFWTRLSSIYPGVDSLACWLSFWCPGVTRLQLRQSDFDFSF